MSRQAHPSRVTGFVEETTDALRQRCGLVFLYGLPALLVLAALFLWQRDASVDYSEGVYALSSRMMLHGAVPYRDFAAAQPPLLFYAGAGALALWDSLDGLRVLLSVLSLATGALVARAVVQLTGSLAAAALAGLFALVSPWALHEHATLTPETFAAPLLLGAAILASHPSRARWAGFVVAIPIGFKLAFVVPALALVWALRGRRRYLGALGATVLVGGLAGLALFGSGVIDDTVMAQRQVGLHSLHEVGALGAQAAWNLGPLVVLAALAVWHRAHARDVILMRTLAALALGELALLATLVKDGSYLNVISVMEPPLIALGAAGMVLLVRRAGRERLRPLATAVMAGSVLLTALQSAAFLAAPTDPGVFVRPLSAKAHQWIGRDVVDEQVRAARSCPRGAPYSGPPFIAFLAHRQMPGNEPDGFIVAQAAIHAPARAAIAADTAACP